MNKMLTTTKEIIMCKTVWFYTNFQNRGCL